MQETDSGLRVFATVRGDPSVTWAEFDPGAGQLSCAAGGVFESCDAPHRLDHYLTSRDYGSLPSEPF